MINVKSFKVVEEQAELNEFLNNAKMIDQNCRVEIHGDYAHVFHEPALELAEMEKLSVKKRLRRAEEALVEAKLHKAFLGVVNLGEGQDQVTKSQDKNAMEIHNLEEQIKLYKTWEVISS